MEQNLRVGPAGSSLVVGLVVGNRLDKPARQIRIVTLHRSLEGLAHLLRVLRTAVLLRRRALLVVSLVRHDYVTARKSDVSILFTRDGKRGMREVYSRENRIVR